MEWLNYLSFFYGSLIIALCLLMFFTSLYEHQKKAALRSIYILPFVSPFFLPLLTISTLTLWITTFLIILTTIFAIYLGLPSWLFKKKIQSIPNGKIDERTIMFARNELKPGTKRFDDYYQEHPEHKTHDDEFRSQAGLLSDKSKFYKPLPFAATKAAFKTVDALHPLVEGQANEQKSNISIKQMQIFINHWLKKNGAHSWGYTELKDYHWYSIGGRGDRYGKSIKADHKMAIAFTVEMDLEMVEAAPKSSIILESASKYLHAGIIAVQLADFIRQNGYEARAHIDGNYQIVAPLVARDAGLGELGRMGLLMNSYLGPRMRIGVVSTNLNLNSSIRKYDDSVEDFCDKCKKCAINCPANAIPEASQKTINGVKRWQINSEACFNYWCTAGTDCGRCMSTCPYSHPNNLLHNLVRGAIKYFPNFRYWAVRMDDYFYGKKLAPGKLPEWMG